MGMWEFGISYLMFVSWSWTSAAGGVLDVRSAAEGDGDTPLHLAANSPSGEIVKLLLAAKASVDVKNYKGGGPQPMS